MTRIHSLLALPVLALAASGAANAAETDTASFQVQIQILESCDISATAPTNIDFGSYTRSTGTPVTSAGTLTVNCSKGTPYQIGLDAGLNADGDQRRMSFGDEFVPYGLYQDSSHTIEWGNNTENMMGEIGTATNQSHTVHGRVPDTNFPAGTYVDTVTARVVY